MFVFCFCYGTTGPVIDRNDKMCPTGVGFCFFNIGCIFGGVLCENEFYYYVNDIFDDYFDENFYDNDIFIYLFIFLIYIFILCDVILISMKSSNIYSTTTTTISNRPTSMSKIKYTFDGPNRQQPDPKHTSHNKLDRFGFTTKNVQDLSIPIIKHNKKSLGSMGNGAPLPILSHQPKLLLEFEYFKQLFAQVTNPPIDPIR